MKKQGKFLGIPYDFHQPTFARLKERMWNPDDERVITPRTSGVGWTLNLYQLKKRSPIAFYALVALFAGTVAWQTWKYFSAPPD